MSRPKPPTLADVDRLRKSGEHARAAEAARSVFAASPGDARAFRVLVELLLARGDLPAAEAACRTALAGGRLVFEGHQLLGAVLSRRGARDEAIAEGRAALALRPDDALTLRNLGALLRTGPDVEEAIALLERAARLAPNDASVHMHLGCALSTDGGHARALVHLERALAIAPHDLDAHSALFGTLHYASDVGAARVAEAHRRFGALLERITPRMPARRSSIESGRRVRLGYVSADFRRHSVAFFLESLLTHHDRAGFELFAYSHTTLLDEVSQRLFACVDVVRDVKGMSDEAVAAQIRADDIDVLVDLAGHTAGNRLGVFARRPAPLQLTWLGYPDTTGLSTMDVRITDAEADPPGLTEAHHSERLVRLPDGFLCYRPIENAPPVAPAPSTRGRAPTFGSFNAITKLSRETLALWARLLRETPEARLVLKHVSLTSAEGRARFAEKLAAHGLASERVDLRGHVPSFAGHLDAYEEIDVALDPFPYHGTTTTCDALYMGVPVVSLLGDMHASRVGASLLARAGLRELAVDDADAYVETARALLRDEPRRIALRATLRARLFAGGLTDAPRFAASFEAAVRAAVCDASGDASRAHAAAVAPTLPELPAETVWRVSREGLRIASPRESSHPVSRALVVRGALANASTSLLRRALDADEVAIDVAADHGVAALSLAHAAGPAHAVFALVDDARVAARLRASARAHRLDALEVREGECGASLAHLVASLGAAGRRVGVVRLGPGAAVPAVLDALAPLLSRDAALVALACDGSGRIDRVAATALLEGGAALHRHAPLLDALVPAGDDDAAAMSLDALFAVLPARAARLAAREALVVPVSEPAPPGDADDFTRALPPALLARFPVLAQAFAAGAPGQRAHRSALVSYARAADASLPLAVRAAHLGAALRSALRALDQPHELARYFTLARVADSFGLPALAIEALRHAAELVTTPQVRLSEPFLAPAPRFDAIDPGARLREWFVAAAVERLEQLSAPAAPPASPEPAALARLETHARLGFPDAEMARRLALRRADVA